MEQELKLRIILESPTKGVDFALQKGKGHAYEMVQKQRSNGKDLKFEFSVKAEGNRFTGPFVQGPPAERFVYIDIGACAGQTDTQWSRRLKVPLRDITTEMIKSSAVLETRVPGTGKDGGPNCATVKPFDGWHGRKA